MLQIRVAFAVIEDLFDKFNQAYPNQATWRHCIKDMGVRCGAFANDVFARSQNPAAYVDLNCKLAVKLKLY